MNREEKLLHKHILLKEKIKRIRGQQMLRTDGGQLDLELLRGAVTSISLMSVQFSPSRFNSIWQTRTGPPYVLDTGLGSMCRDEPILRLITTWKGGPV